MKEGTGKKISKTVPHTWLLDRSRFPADSEIDFDLDLGVSNSALLGDLDSFDESLSTRDRRGGSSPGDSRLSN